MGRYLKTIEDYAITNDKPMGSNELKVVNRCKDRPNHGPTVFSLKNAVIIVLTIVLVFPVPGGPCM